MLPPPTTTAISTPSSARTSTISEDSIAAERETLEAVTRAEGKPEQAVPKIVDGRVNAWIADQVLLEQKMIPDEKQPVEQAIGDAKIVRFVQVVVGG